MDHNVQISVVMMVPRCIIPAGKRLERYFVMCNVCQPLNTPIFAHKDKAVDFAGMHAREIHGGVRVNG